jgi:hypothetical protein
MKNQYIGDINDFHKYALLRSLGGAMEGRVRICWMLTAPDDRSDGLRLGYLDDPPQFRAFDTTLFDVLKRLVSNDERSIETLEASLILSGASFHSQILTDDREARESYFASLQTTLEPNELVFFDPDNGMEVPSVRKGTRKSAKYIYWEELSSVLGDGRAICVYQHFPRRPRQAFVAGLLDRFRALAEEHVAFAVTSSWVAYLVCAPPGSADSLVNAATEIVSRPGASLALTLMDD